jgi:hypothetical protein
MKRNSINHGWIKNDRTSVDQRKQVKVQWLQEHSQINGGRLNNVKYETTVISGTRKNILKV